MRPSAGPPAPGARSGASRRRSTARACARPAARSPARRSGRIRTRRSHAAPSRSGRDRSPGPRPGSGCRPRAPRPRGRPSASTSEHTYRAPRRSGGSPASALEELGVVVLVGRVGSGIAPGPHAGTAPERVDLDPRVVGQRQQAGLTGVGAGLDPRVRLERRPVLDRLRAGRHARVVERDQLRRVEREQLAQLAQLVGRARREDDPRWVAGGRPGRAPAHRLTVASAAACASNSRSSPSWARSSRPFIAARSNGLPSAVPWIST